MIKEKRNLRKKNDFVYKITQIFENILIMLMSDQDKCFVLFGKKMNIFDVFFTDKNNNIKWKIK